MNTHPLGSIEFKANNIKGFAEGGSGFFYFKPITVIVGRNNSGKSSIIDLLESFCGGQRAQFLNERLRRGNGNPSLILRAAFDEHQSLVNHVDASRQKSGWTPLDYDSSFAERKLACRLENGPSITLDLDSADPGPFAMRNPEQWKNLFVSEIINPIFSTRFSRISAERDVQPEAASSALQVSNSGQGVTNLLRAFLHEDRLDISRVEVDLLNDLNEVFLGDSKFERILCRQDYQSQLWEIYLREGIKGDIRLSQSGSSLKTIFLILCYIRLLPFTTSERKLDSAILAVEEPENNLHPALLRRLLEYLARKRDELSASFIFSTHSPVCIDWASRRADSAIIHVRATSDGAACSNTLNHQQRTTILDDLDVRGSDLLQSNGIVWVEGPSDRIYVRKWIDLETNNQLKEGVHYSFLYYGGRILNHFDAANPQELTERVSLLTVNRNSAVIMDSDRHLGNGSRKPRTRLNDTKKRIIVEVKRTGGFSWISEGREVENYIPDEIWQQVIARANDTEMPKSETPFTTKDCYEDIPERTELSGFRVNKVALAHAACEILTEACLDHLDLRHCVSELCEHIRRWNGLPSSLPKTTTT